MLSPGQPFEVAPELVDMRMIVDEIDEVRWIQEINPRVDPINPIKEQYHLITIRCSLEL